MTTTLAPLALFGGLWLAAVIRNRQLVRQAEALARRVEALTKEHAVTRSRLDSLAARVEQGQRYAADMGEHLDRQMRRLIDMAPVVVAPADAWRDDPERN